MADTHTNVLVRMTNEMKGQLQKEALLHDASLTKEITTRLQASLPSNYSKANPVKPHIAAAPAASYSNDKSPAQALSDIDRAILAVVRAMPPEKQLALLSLFK